MDMGFIYRSVYRGICCRNYWKEERFLNKLYEVRLPHPR